MTDNVTNELILEHLKALQEDVRSTRMERREILDKLRAIKGHVAVLAQSDLNRDSQQGNIFIRLDLSDAPAE